MKRLDHWLVDLEKAPSRTKAQELIENLCVQLEGRTLKKSSLKLSEEEAQKLQVESQEILKFVSRGGLKLESALKEISLTSEGLKVLDLGVSTGGFSHCLLEYGAKEVVGIDVGTAQIHPSLEKYENLKVIENLHVAKALESREFKESMVDGFDLLVGDLSFISISAVVPLLKKFLKPEGRVLHLIKPQFELGKKALDKKGLVKKDQDLSGLESDIKLLFIKHGFEVLNYFPSQVAGKDGNQEFFIFAQVST